MYECMYVCYERVCHTISGLKMLHPEDPPTSFGSPKNMWGGYISCGQVKYFSEISCLTPPPKYSRVKGGGCVIGWLFRGRLGGPEIKGKLLNNQAMGRATLPFTP